MNKYHGKIGFVDFVESVPGRWKPEVTERSYYGDVIDDARRIDDTSYQNDDLLLANQFSILADAYSRQNINKIAYIIYNGIKWKVTKRTRKERRLILSVGGVWNGPKQEG